MYQTLFPGGEFFGEAISILRDSYSFLSQYVDPSEGGRALVLAVLSLLLTSSLMIQRRLGNVRSLYLTGLGLLAIHGSMVTLFGLPWFAYPALDHFVQNGNTSAIVMLMSFFSVLIGWGRDCVPNLSGIRYNLSGRFFGSSSDYRWVWAILFFGVLFISFVLVFYRCVLSSKTLLFMMFDVLITFSFPDFVNS
jgi:hypothetical protein